MLYTIYKITNTINGKYYIGKHQTKKLNDGYMGSGIALKKAISLYGKINFIKEILHVFDNEYDMNEKEKEILTEKFINTDDNYNSAIGGEGGPHFKDKKHSPITIEKIKNKRKQYIFTEETKQKISERLKERTKKGENHILSFCGNRKGKKCSEEHKRKIRESLLRRNNKAGRTN